jgi:hypothetical protein
MMHTTLRRFATQLQYSAIALMLLNTCSSHALAQDDHSHATTSDKKEVKPKTLIDGGALIKAVRESTAKYQDVAAAERDGYSLLFGCVSGEDFGAMGLHYVNGNILNSGVLDPAHPTIVIYEPQPDGTKKLIGADFLVIQGSWDATHAGPPEMMGQMFHLFTSPNRFGLPAFYTLHVWAWKENPKGAFTNWHSQVSCDAYTPKP